ncbi:MAG: prolyl-tRNA synthetase associated domain-containing protein [Clostridiales bacterium]|jgi:Ala-tRNA(Pro) deacylase|nr:prolyl-tRNA synthetase associated domain-containing protein [Clostridiales bacterium]
MLHSGRPKNLNRIGEAEAGVYDFLDFLDIEYETAEHESAANMAICKQIEKTLKAPICKNLFLCNRQKTAFYLLLMPGGKPFKTKELSSQIQSARLSFGSAEDMERLLTTPAGSASVLGLIYDKENAVKLLVDEDLLSNEYIGCHPCINTKTVKLRTKDLFTKVLKKANHKYTKVKLIGLD